MNVEYQIRFIRDSSDPALRSLIQIYLAAFPATERKPIAFFDQLFDRTDYRVVVAQTAESAIGLAIVFIPTNTISAALLEYLAVDHKYQGLGIGAALIQQVVQTTGPRPLLVEVESTDSVQGQRRRAFYRRLGFRRIVGLLYILPLRNAPPMELMMANGPVKFDQQTLADWLADWLAEIYQSVYACSLNDPRLATMSRSKIELE